MEDLIIHLMLIYTVRPHVLSPESNFLASIIFIPNTTFIFVDLLNLW